MGGGVQRNARNTTGTLVLLMLLLPAPGTPWAVGAEVEVASQAVDPRFRQFFERYGGVEIFGLPLTAGFEAGGYTVQYFERNRFEYHAELAGTANEVLLGRLGADLTRDRNFAPGPETAPPGVLRFAETGHTLGGGFLAYWQAHNGLRVFGLPLSEPLEEASGDDGRTYWVQYFERARMEWHPEHAGTPYEVLLGRLGAQAWSERGRPLAITPPVELGVYLAMLPWEPGVLDTYTAQVGGAPKTVMLYVDWARPGIVGGSDFPAASVDAILARGATPLLTWEPWDPAGGAAQPTFSLAAIADGRHDAYIRAWARQAAADGRPFYLRLAHEMNTTAYPWGTAPGNANGNTPAQYVAMWRHVHAIFAAEGATNVRWVWSPNTEDATGPSYAQLYPGDAYVDWVGIDGYNGGSALPWGGWRTFAEVFDRSYATMTALTAKPLMLAEIGSAEAGGNKGTWITQGFLIDLPARFPRVRQVVWYNENKETAWRVDSSQNALVAWLQVVASPLYGGR